MNVLAGVVAILAPTLALGQGLHPPCSPMPPPYKFLRFEEDHRHLRAEECRGDFWDSIKVVPFLREGERQVLIGGDARVRIEEGRNARYSATPLEPRADVVQRYHLHVDARMSEEVRAFFELKSNQVSGRDPRPLPTDVDRLDVHQAFVDLGPVRVGRQELAYGAARRLFPRNGPNVRGSFDAVRVVARVGDWRVDGLAFLPVEIDPGKFDDSSFDDQHFWGAYATCPIHGPWRADLYYIGAERDPARFAQGLAREERHTLGVRLFGRSGAWNLDFEPALQLGRFGGGSIRAWAVAGEIGHVVAQGAKLSLRVDAASGDRDPAAARLETFNSLFPRGGVTGELWNFSPANLLHLRFGLDLVLAPRVTAVLSTDAFWRTSRRDGVYGPGGNLVPASRPSSARAVGTDVDGSVTWRVSRQLSLSVAAGYFRNGAYSRESGFGNRQWLLQPYAIFQF